VDPRSVDPRPADRRCGLVAGVDGCPGGWVVATIPVDAPADGEAHIEIETVQTFAQLVERDLIAVGVDMPFMLADDGPRPDETAARRLLGPRRSSIFPSPIRPVLACEDYHEALEVSRAITGKGLSKQAWNLVPKIIEVSDAVCSRADVPPVVLEVSPELSFLGMTGAPMAEPKRTSTGQQDRVEALRSVLGPLPDAAVSPPAPARPDDALDALAVAWSTRRWALGEALIVGENPRFIY